MSALPDPSRVSPPADPGRNGAALLAHLLGDYVVQSDWMAKEKTSRHLPAAVHAVTYAVPFLAVTRRWQPLAVIAGTHFVIDRWRLARHLVWAKNQLAPKAYRYPHSEAGPSGYGQRDDALVFPLLIVADNTMHGLINRWALGRWAR